MRIPAARFTPEDHDVVACLVLHRRGGFSWLCQLLVESYAADRRDADLMLQAQRLRLPRMAHDGGRYVRYPITAGNHWFGGR